MTDLWQLSVPWWDLVLRAVVVYGFLLVLMRVTGRRQIGEYAPFDLILLLIISNAVQNSMNAGDNSLLGGLISATTLLLLHWAMSRLGYRFRAVERLLDGRAKILIHNGWVDHRLMHREAISMTDLRAILRDHDCVSVQEVRLAVLETTGHVTVIRRSG